ncbi:MAG: hypothetical protein OEL55_02695, partial [Desulfobulbaceae bacterium]|nr:hypothetical protein [Desulfobulbaceae bacterium]
EIANRIQLFYKRDWLATGTDTSGFLESTTKESAGSIAKFGLKAKKDGYNFDLIRDPAMAEAVAEFYLMIDAWPSSYFTFMAYLDQFELEKEDVLQLTNAFNKMHKMPVVVRAMDRIFGSGKNKQINLMRVVAENLFYLLKEVTLEEAVLVMDALSIMVYEVGEFTEAIHIIDQLVTQMSARRADTALVSDLLSIVLDMHKVLNDGVSISDQALAKILSVREDSVVMDDYLTFWSIYGYGAGGYGEVPYGGLTEYQQKNPDQIYLFEQLLIVLSALRSDEVQITDALYFSSGYGESPYGDSPYGQ